MRKTSYKLRDNVEFLHRRIDSQKEYIHELFERVSKLEYQLAPKCEKCNHLLTKDNHEG
jgi:hypothetical protein